MTSHKQLNTTRLQCWRWLWFALLGFLLWSGVWAITFVRLVALSLTREGRNSKEPVDQARMLFCSTPQDWLLACHARKNGVDNN